MAGMRSLSPQCLSLTTHRECSPIHAFNGVVGVLPIPHSMSPPRRRGSKADSHMGGGYYRRRMSSHAVHKRALRLVGNPCCPVQNCLSPACGPRFAMLSAPVHCTKMGKGPRSLESTQITFPSALAGTPCVTGSATLVTKSPSLKHVSSHAP